MTSLNSTQFNQEHSAFLERLNEAFEFAGIVDPHDQVEKIAEACKVKARTAKKYLSGKVEKHRWGHGWRVLEVAEALGVDAEWLFTGRGIDPKTKTFLDYMRTLTDKQKNQYVRFSIRLLNNDAKVWRLIEMRNSGQISHSRFLSMM